MLGAIAGDIIGSVHEHIETKTTEFDLFVSASSFTDDTVLAVAVADCLLNGKPTPGLKTRPTFFSGRPRA